MDTSIKRLLEMAGVDVTQGKAKQLVEGETKQHIWSDDYHEFDKSSFKEVDLEKYGFAHSGKTMHTYLGVDKTIKDIGQYLKSIRKEIQMRGFTKAQD